MPDTDPICLEGGGIRTALVTGASSGIGKETARALLAAGYRVYAGARRVGAMRPLADSGARVLALDVADEVSATSAVEAILREAGRIDVLVNCAGYGLYGSVEEAPLQEARRQMEVNLFGPARLIRKVLPIMRAQRSGRIVNVSSSGGRFGGPFGGWYHASKFAMEGLSDSLRMELRAFGIDVVLIEPGAIRTEGNGISRANLTTYSGRGPYRREAGATARMMASADEGPLASPPSVVAATIRGHGAQAPYAIRHGRRRTDDTLPAWAAPRPRLRCGDAYGRAALAKDLGPAGRAVRKLFLQDDGGDSKSLCETRSLFVSAAG